MNLGNAGAALLELRHGELGAPQQPQLNVALDLPALSVVAAIEGDALLTIDVTLPALGLVAVGQPHALVSAELILPRLRGPDGAVQIAVTLPVVGVAASLQRDAAPRDLSLTAALPPLALVGTLRDPRVELGVATTLPRLSVALFASGLDVVTVPVLAPLPLAPNWAHGMRESYEWRTDVLRANAGDEQRIRVRRHPRRALEYRSLVGGRQAQAAVLAARALVGRVCAVGLWMHAGRLVAPAASGAISVAVAVPELGEFRPGGGLLLWHDELDHEYVTVLAAEAGTIALATPLLRAWPAGARVVPTQAMRLEQVRIQHLAAALTEIVVQAIDERGTPLDETERWIGPRIEPLNGARAAAELLLQRPDWGEPQQPQYVRDLARLDSLSGPVWTLERNRRFEPGQPDYVDHLEFGGRPQYRRTLRYVLGDRVEIRRWQAWLGWAAGRLRAFWCPTHSLDLMVDASGPPDASHLADWLALGGLPRLAWVSRRDGMAVIERDAQSSVTLWVSAESRGVFAHWLERVRLDADRIEIAWETDGIARLSLPVVSCHRDSHEVPA